MCIRDRRGHVFAAERRDYSHWGWRTVRLADAAAGLGAGTGGCLGFIDLSDGRAKQNDKSENPEHGAKGNVDAVHGGDDHREYPVFSPAYEYPRQDIHHAGGNQPYAKSHVEPPEDDKELFRGLSLIHI